MKTERFRSNSTGRGSVLLAGLLIFLAIANILALGLEQTSSAQLSPSPVDVFWSSVGERYKTTLRLYNSKGDFSYILELAPANKTTLGIEKDGLLSFLLGDVESWEAGFSTPKQVLFLYVYAPKEAVGGWFDPEKLRVYVPAMGVEQGFDSYQIKGPIADLPGHPLNLSRVPIGQEPLTGMLLLSSELGNKLQRAKREEEEIFLFYKDCIYCTSKSALKLPGI